MPPNGLPITRAERGFFASETSGSSACWAAAAVWLPYLDLTIPANLHFGNSVGKRANVVGLLYK